MKKRLISLALGVCVVMVLAACSSGQMWGQESKARKERVYALVTKVGGVNPYSDRLAEGFLQVIEESGGKGIAVTPETANAETQIDLLQDLISQGVDSIAIAANDTDALSPVLQSAKERGIKISTVDADVNAADRLIFVNQASADMIAQALVEAVYDISGGSGQWAILSGTSMATNQNAWIRAMRKELEKEKYQDMRLVDIVFGDDETEKSREMTEKLLERYPDLKVICAPTTMGLKAVAEVMEAHPESKVRITGLGLPSDMAPYVTGSDPICPYLFLWNPIDLGRLSAYVSLALVAGEIDGTAGETFEAGSMGVFQVELNADGAAEVILSQPIRFDSSNIEEWKDLF